MDTTRFRAHELNVVRGLVEEKVWEKGADFLEELLADKDVRAARSEAAIRENYDLAYHTGHVDTIFKRVFGTS